VQREFESREARAAFQSLKKDNAIKSNYLITTIICVCIAFAIILLVGFNLMRKSRYAANLSALNTAIRRKNDDLKKTFKSLELSHTENNRIMRIVAHDLKNPISAIRSLVFSLLKKEQPPANKEALELIQDTCADSIHLINDLLDNKRSLKDISKELVDIGRLIEQCSTLFQVKAAQKNQQIILDLEHSYLLMNRQKIWRVISNIINNAIKFSPQNSAINIRLEKNQTKVLLSVQDYGIGIPKDLQEIIFTMNPDKSRDGTAGEKSYGLGLSISRKIVEEHNGRLWFTSEAGKGSVFFVELPYSSN